MKNEAVIAGGGFAGCECACALSRHGIPVTLYEMKPSKFSPAHVSPMLCELVCSNSFKSSLHGTAAGLMKEEMEMLGSVCVPAAKQCAVPAGGALAVDRDAFGGLMTSIIENDPNITLKRCEMTQLPQSTEDKAVIIAAGPLCSDALSQQIISLTGHDSFSFYDAAAPVISADSVDMSKAFFMSRYGKGDTDDYLNCPMTEDEYKAFYEQLIGARVAKTRELDKRHGIYEGCMPIEIMASRGQDTMRFGPLKPVGLTDPHTGKRPYAVIQLRKENAAGTMYNMVGFQTNLAFPEQKRVFSMIPALHDAEFLRYGVMHKNTYIDSPRLLDETFMFRGSDALYFAGQITGVEGYMESALSGLIAGENAARRLTGKPALVLPPTTMTGAFQRYISSSASPDYQPMGANFGMLPPLDVRIKDKRERYGALADRAISAIKEMSDHENNS